MNKINKSQIKGLRDHSPVNLRNINNNNINIKLPVQAPTKRRQRPKHKQHVVTEEEIHEALNNLEYNDKAYTTQVSHGGSISYGSGGNMQLPEPHAILNRPEHPQIEFYKPNALFQPIEKVEDLQKPFIEDLQKIKKKEMNEAIMEKLGPLISQYEKDRNMGIAQYNALKDSLSIPREFENPAPLNSPLTEPPEEPVIEVEPKIPIIEPVIKRGRGRPKKTGVNIRPDRNEGIVDEPTFIKQQQKRKYTRKPKEEL